MAIHLISLKCPDCGATFDIEGGDREFAYCKYCGAKILIHNDADHTYRFYDYARMKEADVELERLKQQDKQEKKETASEREHKKWVLLTAGMFVAAIGLHSTDVSSPTYGLSNALMLASIISFFYGRNKYKKG